MGTKANFQQVFGTSAWHWFLPVANYLGTGLNWPAKIPNSNSERSAANDVENDRAQLLTDSNVSSSPSLNADRRTASPFARQLRSDDQAEDDLDFESATY